MQKHHRGPTDAEIETAMCRHGGCVGLVAAELGVSRQAIYYRLSKSPELRASADDIQAELLDECMAVVTRAVTAGDGRMSRWYLDHFAQDRGYGRGIRRQSACSQAEMEKFIVALGGDVSLYRAALAKRRRHG